MTGLILLCLLISTKDRIQKFWLGTQWANLKILKWNQYHFTTKHFPFPNVVVISFGCRGTPTLLDDPKSLC